MYCYTTLSYIKALDSVQTAGSAVTFVPRSETHIHSEHTAAIQRTYRLVEAQTRLLPHDPSPSSLSGRRGRSMQPVAGWSDDREAKMLALETEKLRDEG